MTYRLSYESQSKEWEQEFGRYNDPPPNLKEITREEYDAVVIHGCYAARLKDFRQVRPEGAFKKLGFKSMTKMHLHVYEDKTGVAVTSVYDLNKATNKYEYTARYFSFAVCEHTMHGLSQQECREAGIYHGGRCYHVSRCTKCGYVSAVDSSD
jgi:hypothetical protein